MVGDDPNCRGKKKVEKGKGTLRIPANKWSKKEKTLIEGDKDLPFGGGRGAFPCWLYAAYGGDPKSLGDRLFCGYKRKLKNGTGSRASIENLASVSLSS